jgi:hypothetical protein
VCSASAPPREAARRDAADRLPDGDRDIDDTRGKERAVAPPVGLAVTGAIMRT